VMMQSIYIGILLSVTQTVKKMISENCAIVAGKFIRLLNIKCLLHL